MGIWSARMSGRVYLVGAGPGDPGLLTARALELIATADVILHDRLIPAAALDGARADAELVFVGKEGGGASVPQERTEALMVERAQAGKTVVRLKGGDPFVFGRGGEEALTLRAAEIPYEVVPGVTAGLGALAYAGIPVTHRGLASAVALVTGHTRAEDSHDSGLEQAETGGPDGEETDLDWEALAAFPGTLVFYMGVRRLPQIAESLIAAGRDESEPAAVVEAGTLPAQRTVTGSLETIAQSVQREGDPRPVDHRRGTGRGARRAALLAGTAPARGAHGGGHTRARPGQRARAEAGRAGGTRGAGARDPHPIASRPPA